MNEDYRVEVLAWEVRVLSPKKKKKRKKCGLVLLMEFVRCTEKFEQ